MARRSSGPPANCAPAATPGRPEPDMRLEKFSSPEVRALPMDKLIVLAPLGFFEQHGPHLPLTTDTDIVTAVATAVDATLPEQILCLPGWWLGDATHHMSGPRRLDVA